MWNEILLGVAKDLAIVAGKVLATVGQRMQNKAEREAHFEQMRREWVEARMRAEAEATGKTIEELITEKEK